MYTVEMAAVVTNRTKLIEVENQIEMMRHIGSFIGTENMDDIIIHIRKENDND